MYEIVHYFPKIEHFFFTGQFQLEPKYQKYSFLYFLA